jgi:hypothetical protein
VAKEVSARRSRQTPRVNAQKFQAEQTTMIREMQQALTLLINQLKTDQATQIDRLQADIEAKS